jgi:hypothetical protein
LDLSGGSSTFGRAVFFPFSCLFGFCLHREPGAFLWQGEAVSSAVTRALLGVPARPASSHPDRDDFLCTHPPKVWTLVGGAWSPSLLPSPCFTLPRTFFSLLFLPPFNTPFFPFSSSPKGASCAGLAEARGSCALGTGFQEDGANVGAGDAGRHRPSGVGGGRHRRGLLSAARARAPEKEGRSVRRRDDQTSGPGTREAAATL